MFIQNHSIKNFRNIKSLDLKFSKINVFVGENGSGKSSVLSSIKYLLTDSLEEKLSEYVYWNQDEFKIVSKFIYKAIEHSYDILYSGSTKKKLLIGKEEFLNSDATKKMASIINPPIALYSVISAQGESYSLLSESPSTRLQKFKSILGMDIISEISDKMKQDASSYQLKEVEIKTQLESLKLKQFNYLPIIELEDITQIEKDLETQKTYKVYWEEIKNQIIEYNSNHKQYLKTQKDLQDLKEQIDELKLAEYPFEEVDKISYEKLLEEISSIKEKQVEYKNQLEKYNEFSKRKEELSNGSKDANLRQFSLQKKLVPLFDISETENLISQKISESLELEQKIKTINKHINLAKSGKCSECGQDFVHDYKKLEKQAELLQTEYKKTLEEKTSLNALLLEQKKSNETQTNLLKQIETLKEREEFFEKQLKELIEVDPPKRQQFNIEEFLKQKTDYDTQIEFVEKQKRLILKRDTNLASLQEQFDKLLLIEEPIKIDETSRTYINSRKYDQAIYDTLLQKIASYNENVKQLKVIEEHNNRIKLEEEETKNLILEKQKEYETITSEIEVLKQSKTILDKQFSSFLIDKATIYVQEKMNEFFQKSYGGYDIFFQQSEKKNSIEFYYSDSEAKKIVPASIASGYEKQLLSMAFRIALGSILDLGIYILDEIDSDSSVQNSITFYNNILNEEYEQMFIVTHKQETIEYIQNNFSGVSVFELEDGKLK